MNTKIVRSFKKWADDYKPDLAEIRNHKAVRHYPVFLLYAVTLLVLAKIAQLLLF